MSKSAPPTVKDVERGLASAGFERHPNKNGGSHQKWIKYERIKGKLVKRVVTVDPPKSPFSIILVKSMANQAGLTKKQFLELCTKEGARQAKEGLLGWLSPAVAPE